MTIENDARRPSSPDESLDEPLAKAVARAWIARHYAAKARAEYNARLPESPLTALDRLCRPA